MIDDAKIQYYRQKYNVDPSKISIPGAGTNSTTPDSKLADFRAALGQSQKEQELATGGGTLEERLRAEDTIGSRTGAEQVAGVNKIKKSVTRGAENLNEGTAEGGLKGAGKALMGVGQAAFGTISGAARAVGAPITAVVEPIISKGIEKIPQAIQLKFPMLAKAYDLVAPAVKPQIDAVIEKGTEITNKNPELTTLVGDMINTALIAVGGNKQFDDVVGAVKNTFSKEGATLAKQSISSLPGDIKAGVKSITSILPEKSLENTIQNTMPLLDKAQRKALLESTSYKDKTGAIRKGKLGKTVASPTAEDIERGTVAHEFIGGEKDYVKQIGKLNDGIASTSEKVNQFADKYAAPTNFEYIDRYIKDNLTPSAALKKDPRALESYTRATSNASDIVADALRKTAEQTGDYSAMTSSTPIRQARIELDKQIQDEFGKAVFGTPQYYGIKAAEIDARNMLNALQQDLVRYPGQLDKLNLYNQAINDFASRGIKITSEMENALKNKFALKSTQESEAAAQQIANEHRKMNLIYDARDNIINNKEGNVGKNKIQEYLKSNPVLKGAISTVTRGASDAAMIAPMIN